MELPDPTADLHWSYYRGAIHDIFSANAARHPDRLCVVETQSSRTPRREFTYSQINIASNQVAHHLLQNGIERGDVVMIYAHRGVDLVVSVFGVLKAGATFSVIDPAYPSDRQIIYLDVAKPKALIIIEKASQEAGELTEEVRSYISNNLHLKTEIPALALQDNGDLKGGQRHGQDVLAPHDHLVYKLPGLVIGVQGRHFSLAYYFPWMAKTFNLSENDKFTMLSGIAHDPIQRDMFTPLFLGAQLLVPTKEDIQHELLAEWMKREGATVTHLTPAMGQILVGGASTEFPSLHHSFFVGDILIRRDVRRLQELAPNVAVVNMFGTTETQRAVSFFEIPSRNQDPSFLDSMTEVIPAGRGMLDVQLLVVNREDRTKQCSIGEVGEIYVRAGGLAEGYLGEELAELTKTKFVENWFVDPRKWVEQDKKRVAQEKVPAAWRAYYKGPRDRLYRSGDLGRYMPSGDVECTGRADNQVKIRGFRIELGEIDKWVSEHHLCQENVTLLRRDKDEEPILVTYLVPNLKQWKIWLDKRGVRDESEDDESMAGLSKRFQALRSNLRDYLKTKLPAYAVPTAFCPLRRMPLNPNGKIDKPALPSPNMAELATATIRGPLDNEEVSLTETEKTVAEVWAKVIPHTTADVRFLYPRGVVFVAKLRQNFRPDDSFFDVGGHSILAQKLLAVVRKRWQEANISIATLMRNPTLGAFAAEIDRSLDPIGLRLDVDGQTNDISQEQLYSADVAESGSFEKELLWTYPSAEPDLSQQATVFLTGATGFLGAYILRDILSRPRTRVIAHIRAATEAAGLERVIETCRAYGIWSDHWLTRLSCVTGDLAKANLGLGNDAWNKVANEADIVIHNGAKVHWATDEALKPANVFSTLTAMSLCRTFDQPKYFCFISSTSVLDTDHYIQLSSSGTPVRESDDLEGSRLGLGTGYGQSKWVSEYLVREAGKRGLRGCIVRPGYVTGDTSSGGKDLSFFTTPKKIGETVAGNNLTMRIVTNTDDFLIRHLKGCIQLNSAPIIPNGINMVPVDHVAHCVVACSFHPPNSSGTSKISVAQITANPRLTFTELTNTLKVYGYDVDSVAYEQWKQKLVQYVEGVQSEGNKGNEEHALMPLYHFVTGDLPSTTRAPLLDDSNTRAALAADSMANERQQYPSVTPETIGLYIAYLVRVGFLSSPAEGGMGKALPQVKFGEGMGLKGRGRG
ncbi:MAG: hypothetical protein Q9172_006708 [Xanthocarpia lactea]